jgi:hypothetical protein
LFFNFSENRQLNMPAETSLTVWVNSPMN